MKTYQIDPPSNSTKWWKCTIIYWYMYDTSIFDGVMEPLTQRGRSIKEDERRVLDRMDRGHRMLARGIGDCKDDG